MSNPFGYQSTYNPFGNQQQQPEGMGSPLQNPLYSSKAGSGVDSNTGWLGQKQQSSVGPNGYMNLGDGSAFDLNWKKEVSQAYGDPGYDRVRTGSTFTRNPGDALLGAGIGSAALGPAGLVGGGIMGWGKKENISYEDVQRPWANPIAAFQSPSGPAWGSPAAQDQTKDGGFNFTPTQNTYNQAAFQPTITRQGNQRVVTNSTPMDLYNQINSLTPDQLTNIDFSQVKKAFDDSTQSLSNAWANANYGAYRNSNAADPNKGSYTQESDTNWMQRAYRLLIQKADSMHMF